MKASEYFERTLFYDRSPDATDYYESSASHIFQEGDTAHIEVRVQTCSKFLQLEKAASDHISDSNKASGHGGALESPKSVVQLVDRWARKVETAEPVHHCPYPLKYEEMKVLPEVTHNVKADTDDNRSVSSQASSTALPPAIDQRHGSSDPPLYPGRPELAVLRLALDNIENFVHETKTDFRVFYLRQQHSYSQLQITKDAFERLLESCHIFPRFTEYVTGLCRKTCESEVGPPPLKFRPLHSARDSTYRGFECCYVLRYARKPQRPGGQNMLRPRKLWSLRQFAVYHRYKPAQGSPCSTWILAGMPQCTEPRLDHYTRNVRDLAKANPFELHIIFLDTSITNWRPYMAHLTRLVKEQSGKSSGFTLSGDGHKNLVPITVEDHQQLKEIEDDVADLVLCLDSTLDTLTTFVRMYGDFQTHHRRFQTRDEPQAQYSPRADAIAVAFEEKAQEISYTRKKAESLLSKIQNTRTLVSSLLERQSAHNINQQITALKSLEQQGQQENKNMRQLTEKSSRNASSMRILTIITMVYLPCTIVSNFFSTQFVNQIKSDAGNLTLEYAKNTWLFFAISVPLTVFTIFVWFLWVNLSTYWENRGSKSNCDIRECTEGCHSIDVEANKAFT